MLVLWGQSGGGGQDRALPKSLAFILRGRKELLKKCYFYPLKGGGSSCEKGRYTSSNGALSQMSFLDDGSCVFPLVHRCLHNVVGGHVVESGHSAHGCRLHRYSGRETKILALHNKQGVPQLLI